MKLRRTLFTSPALLFLPWGWLARAIKNGKEKFMTLKIGRYLQRGSLAVLFVLAFAVGLSGSTIISDSFNASANPPPNTIWGPSEVGWLYTPSFGYDLVGVETKFGDTNPFFPDTRIVRVEVYDEHPLFGGTLLRFADFSTLEFEFYGGIFFPLTLVGGEDYFIGFRNTTGLGTNITFDAGDAISDTFFSGEMSTLFPDFIDGTYPSSKTEFPHLLQPIIRFLGPGPDFVPPPLLPPGPAPGESPQNGPIPAPEFSGKLYGMPNFGWIISLGGGLLGLTVIRQRHSRG